MTQIKVIRIPGSEYGDSIILDEYNGTYSLVAGRQAKDDPDKFYTLWAFPQDKNRQPRDTAVPVKVKLGDNRVNAAKFLRQMADKLDRPDASHEIKPEDKPYAADLPF